MRSLSSIFFVMIVLTACNSGGGGSSKSSSHTSSPLGFFISSAVASDVELPTCNLDTHGKLFYIESSSTFQVCKESGWSEVIISAPTTGSIPEIRFTRATIQVDSSDALKDSLCSSEFGSKYEAGTRKDLALQWKGIQADPGSFERTTVAGLTDEGVYMATASSIDYLNGDGTSTDSYNVACVIKLSSARFTRATIQVDSSDALKDSLCSSEFGSKYEAGTRKDLALQWKGIQADPGSFERTTVAGLTDEGVYMATATSIYYLNGGGTNTDAYNVFCIRNDL